MKTQSQYALGTAGLNLIKTSESLELRAYLCPANKLTIGFGHVIQAPQDYLLFKGFSDRHALQAVIDACQHGRRLTPQAIAGLFISPAQADTLLRNDTRQVAEFISSVSPSTLTPNQFDALVSLVFNIGQGNYAGSTLKKELAVGNIARASREFERWVYGTVNGKKVSLPGLVIRCKAERTLFDTP
jgi:lysozyme